MLNPYILKRRLKLVALLVFSLLILVAALGLYLYKTPALNLEKSEQFIVTSEDTPESLSMKLERQYGLKYPSLFLKLSERMNLRSNMKKGRYKIEPKMTLVDLIKLFREGKMKTTDLVIAPGISLETFANRCGDKLEADTIDFLNILQDTAFLDSFGFTPQTVYAMILPDKYNLYWHTQADELMQRLYKEYTRFWGAERLQKLQRTGLSALEVSILASIVSKETNKTDEMPDIAGMYINRLRLNMPLQADPTVKFALDSPGLKRILTGHLQVESPYNTYRNKGLPPGPICIPGKKAIDAVLNFSEHNYLYMCAKEDFSGYHNFASTYDQHLKFAALYRKALDARNIH